MRSGVIPPTGRSGTSGGNTALHAFTTAGGSASPGKSFSPSAPAASAAKPSVGVATPGRHQAPALFAARITSGSECGMTMSLPPASTVFRAASGDMTVPAPISASSPKRCARISIERNGSGELSGTSIRRKPASTSAAPIGSASSGVMPRRIATSGSAAIASFRVIATSVFPRPHASSPAMRAIAT